VNSRSSRHGTKMRLLPPTTVMLLHGFDGGIVNKSDVAFQLAEIIRPTIVEGSPPAIDDRGDQWRISNVNRSHHLTIRKLDAAVLAVDGEHSPHALPTPKTAEKYTAILVEGNYGDGELERQLPFTILDKGGVWEVIGHGDPNRSGGGSGRFHLEVQKQNAQVLDMSFQWAISMPPEVKNLRSKPINWRSQK
jgi:hypothetical protein